MWFLIINNINWFDSYFLAKLHIATYRGAVRSCVAGLGTFAHHSLHYSEFLVATFYTLCSNFHALFSNHIKIFQQPLE